MRIHIISTINGKLDEGMRNIATHLARELSQEHTVYCSELKDVTSIIVNNCRSDYTFIFARCNAHVYWLARLISWTTKHLWVVCVQQPDEKFLALVEKKPLCASYLSIVAEDLKRVTLREGFRKEVFALGIDREKFCPVSQEKQRQLKAKFGFDPDQPLVVHVGHCSQGRGLTDFSFVTGTQKMVVASGMFSHEETVLSLAQDGVYVHQGYLPHIEHIYQMADVYLFPTRSAEYVISLPLSVMEALSCGVPVVGYQVMENLMQIPAEDGAMLLVADSSALNAAVRQLFNKKAKRCLLTKSLTWAQTAQNLVSKIQEGEE